MNSDASAPERGLLQNPLWRHIESWAEQHPEKVCVTETSGASCTYRELVRSVDAVAGCLIAEGFSKGDRALFLARPNIESITYLIAILRAGGIPVLADPGMGREAFKSRIALAKPKWMILEPMLYAVQSVPGLEGVLRSFGLPIPDTGRPESIRRVRIQAPRFKNTTPTAIGALREEDDALIVFTSGTTSLPKGVAHTYQSILATLELIKSDLKPDADDVFYASQSYFLLMAFLSGAKAVLPRAQAFAPETFFKHLESFKVTKAFLLPAEGEELIAYCTQNGKKIPSGLKTLMLGSAPVLKGFLTRLAPILGEGTEVLCVYGATEIIPIARISMKEKLAYAGAGDILGTPFSSVTARIEKEEIIAQGANLARGYLEGEPFKEYATGDLGTIDAEGRIILLGRKKDMIIKGNYNIYPTLFESVISSIPGVRRCAMVGRYREEASDEEIILVIEPESSEAERELQSRLKQQLVRGSYSIDSHAQPDRIIYMPIPLGGRSRKIDKEALRALIPSL